MNRNLLRLMRAIAFVGFFLSLAVGSMLTVNAVYRLYEASSIGLLRSPSTHETNQALFAVAIGLMPIAPFALLFLYCSHLLLPSNKSLQS